MHLSSERFGGLSRNLLFQITNPFLSFLHVDFHLHAIFECFCTAWGAVSFQKDSVKRLNYMYSRTIKYVRFDVFDVFANTANSNIDANHQQTNVKSIFF